MRQARFPAMGTTVDVVAQSDDAIAAVIELFGRTEQRFSRFRADSELSAINESRLEALEVSPEMAEVLTLASDLRCRTGGLVDPLVGASIAAWGYDRTFGEVRDLPDGWVESRPVPDWQIEGRIFTRPVGSRLDLGGIVKGWTADHAVDAGMASVVSAGGDLRSEDPALRVEIEDPWGRAPTPVVLGRGALATSSVARRRWKVGEIQAHHLIDPRTGSPADGPVVTATAACRTAVAAEAAAKAMLITGAEALVWAEQQEWVGPAMVTWHDGSVFATRGWEVAA